MADLGNFNIFLPMVMSKAGAEPAKDGKFFIHGIATTPSKDLQGDVMNLDGLDWSYFEKHGWFDDDHDSTVEGGLGRPTAVRPKVRIRDVFPTANVSADKVGAYVKGYIYDTDKTKPIQDLLNAMQKAGDPDGIGLSVRGPIELRTGPNKEIIAKGIVRSVAITRQPVNTDTLLQAFSKSLSDATKSLSAEGILPGTTGNDTGAPLLRRDIQGSTNRSKKMKKAKDFLAALDDDKAAEVAKALGYDPTDGERNEDDERDDMEKSLTRADQMIKSLGAVSEHIREGGAVELVAADAPANTLLAIEKATEALGEMSKSLLSQSDAVVALGEFSKALHKELTDLRAAQTAQATVQETQYAEMVKALKIPAMPKGVAATGDVIERTDAPREMGDIVPLATVHDECMKSLKVAKDKGDMGKVERIKAFHGVAHIPGRKPVTKAELDEVLR